MKSMYQEVLTKLNTADCILIGASNGLAISEGYNIFAEDSSFLENFGDFREKYDIHSILQGAFYRYPSEEEKWAFFSRMYAYFLKDKSASLLMKNLYDLVKEKNYFIVTSNTDSHFVLAGFPENRLFEIEGNIRFLQCSNGCHNQLYPGEELLNEMAQNQTNGKVPSELIPECSVCGGPMQVNVEVDSHFLKGETWQKSYQAYQTFLEHAHNKKIVLLELGIGARNQLIKAPFMNLTHFEQRATYVTVNQGRELYIPDLIADKALGINGDIAEVLAHLVQQKQN